MDDSALGWWFALVLGILPLMGWLLWSWNELRFLIPLKAHSGATKVPPGHMGLPLLGEMLTFLWYFKIARRPDDFIISKQHRYGEEKGMYRTHLFGSPTIVVCSPAINKFVLQSDDLFTASWPSIELIGYNSLAGVQGKAHARLKSYVTNTINQPEALRQIALMIQPLMASSFRSWADKHKIRAFDEVKKVIFGNIGSVFVSFEPGPLLETLDQYFAGLLGGLRAQRINLPGTAYRHALQCRTKLMAIFRTELEKRKQSGNGENKRNDLMEGLMQMKDEEGKKLRDEEVLDNIVSLVVAGYESSAITSMWALYYLAKFPKVLQNLREENMAISQKKRGEFITSEDVKQMKYTNKVVEETIRMTNISPFQFRSVNKDVDYQGYRLPKSWRVLVWGRTLHTNPKNFKDPMNFNPDRWNEPAKPGTYQPFGGGVRICPGNMLARMQVAIFLHHLATGYKWELINPNAKIAYLPHPRPMDGVEIAFSEI